MSNITVPISEWCKEIRVALARKEMNLQSVADEIGYSYTTITALISGRIVKDNYLDIAKKINEALEVNVLPEKPQLPSDEWCGAVRAKLYVKKMNISELSKSMGNIVECERKVSKSDDVFNVVAYDNLFNLQKSSDNVYFASGKKTKSILTAIFKSWGITISKYTGPNVAHKKILLKNKKLGDIIREVLDEAKKKGGGAAIVRSTESKVQVIAKGSNTDIYHFSGDVSSQVSHKISIANLVTRVKIVSSGKSDEAAKVEATVNGKTQYGVFQTIITHSKSDKLDDAKKEAKEILEEKGSPKVTSKLIAPDIPCVRKGDIIHAKVGSLNGYYLINSIQHNAKNGQMTMDVKKTAGLTATPKKKTSGTTKKKTYKVGDVVNFKGGTHYDSSWSDARGYRATAGKAKITLGPNCAGNGKAHPWHLVHMDSKSNVYGWVDEGTFE